MYRPRSLAVPPFVTLFILLTIAALSVPSFAGARVGSTGSSAHVYVGSPNGIVDGYIYEFAVAPDGSAQPVSGSPVAGAAGSVVGATNTNYVFATDGRNIVTYTAASNGALSQTSSVNGIAYDQDQQSASVQGLSTPSNGSNVYSFNFYFDGANNDYETWAVGSNGYLNYRAPGAMPVYATAGGWPLAYTAD